MLSEISQTHERTDSAGFHLHVVPEMVRVLETESRVGGSRDLGGGWGWGSGVGVVTARVQSFSLE